jgi:uncharacterized protein (TIGR03000 family)
VLASTPSSAQQASKSSPAQVTVQVPSTDAELWFNGVLMPGVGTTRTFTTPPLVKGEDYHYLVRARWMENGRVIETTRTVPVAAGRNAFVNFGQPLSSGVTYIYVIAPASRPMEQPSDVDLWRDWRPSP